MALLRCRLWKASKICQQKEMQSASFWGMAMSPGQWGGRGFRERRKVKSERQMEREPCQRLYPGWQGVSLTGLWEQSPLDRRTIQNLVLYTSSVSIILIYCQKPCEKNSIGLSMVPACVHLWNRDQSEIQDRKGNCQGQEQSTPMSWVNYKP